MSTARPSDSQAGIGMRCPTCGATYSMEARFCTRDGARLVRMIGAPPATAFARPNVPPAASDRPTLAPDGRPYAVGATAHTGEMARPARPAPRASESVQQPGNLTGELLDSRYRIERKVGEGGMSYVYLALDSATGQRRAIKVLSPALAKDRTAMARLRREAGLGRRLAHPNVCHIEHLGETPEGVVYVVMPFVEGELLADRTHRLGNIPIADTVTWVTEMAAGLNAAHDLGIVHRDLKPENVMLCRRPDGAGEGAVVMDFGLAKERLGSAEIEKLTATGIVLGTPEFMSPEQLRGRPLDARTDIYSLALVACEMLTGKLPFEGRTQQELMIARLRSEPQPLRRMRPEFDFPAALERAVLRGLERDPERRFLTAPLFARAFAEGAAGREPAAEGGGGHHGLFGRLFGR